MPRDLFGDLQQPVRVTTRSRYTVPASLAAHLAAVGVLVAGTLLAPAVLPAPAAGELILLASLPMPEPAPVRLARVAEVPATRPDPAAAPLVAPSGVAPEPVIDFTLPADTRTSAVIPGTEHFDTVVAAPPPPPPAPAGPVRIGGDVKPPAKLVDVVPVYPPLALAARIDGVVIIEATIGADGRVSDARVLRSPPMLDAAALAAVRQWVYRPTLLNGVPVPVVMTVTVRFDLR